MILLFNVNLVREDMLGRTSARATSASSELISMSLCKYEPQQYIINYYRKDIALKDWILT